MTLTDDTTSNISTHRGDPVAVARELAAGWRDGLAERDRDGGPASREKENLRRSGLLSLAVPEEYGGWGADWPTVFAVIREIAKVDGSLGHLYGYHLVCAAFVELLGSPDQRDATYRRVVEGSWTGNASSENNSHILDWKVRATPREDGGYVLDGTKHFCSGALGSDLLLVFGVAQDDDAPERSGIITAVIPTDREGVRPNNDWNALGMRRTDSGTTDFHQVEVLPHEVLGAPNSVITEFFTFGRASLFGPLVQLIFSNVYVGIATGALESARDYTLAHARPWTPAGVTEATQDPYVVRTFGELAIALQGADAAARDAAHSVQRVWEKGAALTPADRASLMVQVSGVKVLATEAGLSIGSRIFEVIGARGTHPRFGLDRFWRNIRTHSLHDPVSYKIADVGQHFLNGRDPVPGFTS
jgi:alkylation response protein AidB-like acyl-CoA dehydrogenase